MQCEFYLFVVVFQVLKPSDVTIDMNEKALEASIFIYDWVFEIRLGEGDEHLVRRPCQGC